METATRNAVIGQDMNRMGEPTLQGASSRPVAKLPSRDIAAERQAAGDEIIRRAMAKVAAEEAASEVEDADAIRQRLLNQVAGK